MCFVVVIHHKYMLNLNGLQNSSCVDKLIHSLIGNEEGVPTMNVQMYM